MGRTATFKANESRLPTGMVPKAKVEVEESTDTQDGFDKSWKVADIDAFAAENGIEVSGTKNQKIAQIEEALKARETVEEPAEAGETVETDEADQTEDAPAEGETSEDVTTEEN